MPKTKGAKGTKVTLKMAKKAVRTTMEGRHRLTLANMGIVTFPKCILNLDNIDELDLSRNQLEKIPNDIGDFLSLMVLDLHSNRLKSVPEAIGNLKKLEYLNLSNNFISTLPSTVGSLTHLKVFNVGMNHLDSLPTSMEKLENLQELGLFDNQLKTLPSFVNDLPSLIKLNLRRNPMWYSQGGGTTERGNVYLVHENSLCKACLKKCQQQKQRTFTQGSRNEAAVDEEVFKSKRSGMLIELLTPNSVAKVNQQAWRIRKVF
ncbi:hypothetical protein NL108_012915 [Boleophthalmus pectinirostris]|nr:hypothetical protein NL108_012915 [Boleophthalmus pectinirostris]